MVDLPQPDGPTSATKSPFSIRRIGLGQRVNLPLAAAVGVRHLLQLDEGVASATAGTARRPVLSTTAARLMRRAPVRPALRHGRWPHGVVGVLRTAAAACAGSRAPSGPSRACRASSARSFITKRPRTSVWIGRPFTRRPWNGVIRDSDCSLASSIDPFAGEIDDRDVGVGAGLDDALARIEPPDLRRIGRAPAHVVARC